MHTGKAISHIFVNLYIVQCGPFITLCLAFIAGMRKFRIDQDFLIEHWHMIYIMPAVFAEIYF